MTVFLLVLLSAIAVTAGGMAQASTLVVDADRVQCPAAGFTTIHAAVAAASPGDTIQVCPDTYAGTIDLTKSLTIQGPGHWGDCLTPAPADPTRDAIVQGGFGFQVFANNVTIEGLVIQDTPIGFNPRVVTSGHSIRNNLFQRDFQAFSLGFRQISQVTVEGNCFRQNTIGIGSTGGVVSTTITGNTFFSNTYGLQYNTNLGQTLDVEITDNVSTGDSIFIFMGGATPGSRISHNHVVNANVGLQIAGRNNGLAINANIFEATGTAVQIFSYFTQPGPNTDLTISGNEVTRASQFGIFADRLEASHITFNDIRDSGLDAVRITTTSSGNVITDNKLKRSGEHDCHDDSVDGGTAGTANTWMANKGKTENRPGLCDKNN